MPQEEAPHPDIAPTSLSAEPLVLEWKEAEADTPSYRPNLPEGDTRAALAVARPERMRLPRQLNGQNIIEGTARMLGIWPPGYESDPCPRVQRNIAKNMSDTSSGGRARLAEDLPRQRVACRQ